MRSVVTFNAGSSSLKYAAFASSLELLTRGQVDDSGPKAVDAALDAIAKAGIDISKCGAISHRIVHGGISYVQPILVDDAVQNGLENLRRFAPLHMPFGLGALKSLRVIAPHVSQIACFDTAFHSGRDDIAVRLPLPWKFHERGYRKYGFHGLNYEHIVRALPLHTGKPLPRRLLAAHLGNGSSMCAILDGRSVETTMGFSTADGLVMGTRTGSLDPGAIVALMRDEDLSVDEIEALIYRQSGLLGLSGISSDMRVLLTSEAPEAQNAIRHYCYQAARHAASLAATMGGIDAIVFSGGIGENSGPIRDDIISRLGFLGAGAGDVHVIKADEELTLARHALGFVGN
jgi:acetate kinase